VATTPPPPPPPPPPGYPPPGNFPPGNYPPGGGAPFGSEKHPRGTTILVLGILSLVCCGLLGPVTWIMGNNALREIDSMPGRYSNRGVVNAGRICGIVGTVFLVISVVYFGVGSL
jgi:hypothetical protein